MSLIRKHVAVLQAWASLALVTYTRFVGGNKKKIQSKLFQSSFLYMSNVQELAYAAYHGCLQ